MTSRTDLITSFFEAITIALIAVDVRAIYKDKVLKGSRVWPKFYWFGYGCWGTFLLYVYHLPLAFWICFSSEVLYLFYIFLCLYYGRQNV